MRSEFFNIRELVPPETYEKYGDFAWKFLNKEAVQTLNELRILLGKPITVNNWVYGGNFRYRGLRTMKYYIDFYLSKNESDEGLREYLNTRYSQHIYGNAFDFDVKGMEAEEVREKIRTWKKQGVLQHLTRIEKSVNWVHFDCANVDSTELVEFNP